jgi:hypothetical protein
MPVTLEADMIAKTSSNVEAQRAAAPGRGPVALALQGGGSTASDHLPSRTSLGPREKKSRRTIGEFFSKKTQKRL